MQDKIYDCKAPLTFPALVAHKGGAKPNRGTSGPCGSVTLADRFAGDFLCRLDGISYADSESACFRAGGKKSGTVSGTREGRGFRLGPSNTVSLFLRLRNGRQNPLNLTGGATMAQFNHADAIVRLIRVGNTLYALAEELPHDSPFLDLYSLLGDTVQDCVAVLEKRLACEKKGAA